MKKLFTFFAIGAIVLGLASCGGNEPTMQDFQFKIETLSEKTHFVVTPPANNQKEYFWWYIKKSEVESRGSLRKYVEYKLADNTYDYYKGKNMILINADDYPDDRMSPETEYVVYACFIEKEGNFASIVGEISSQEFKTMPENTLNGEFTVNADGKKVHFAQGNRYVDSDENESYFGRQTTCYCYASGYPMDLLTWSRTTAEEAATASDPFFTLSRDEWWYLFRERDRAEHLFAHATITFKDGDLHGLLILPDNWQTPDGIPLTTDYDLEIRWDDSEKEYVKSGIEGFEQNKLTPDQWETIEYAGAVFLPAAGANGANKNNVGWYWTATSYNDNTALAFSFNKEHLDLSCLKTYASFKTTSNAIRNVRIVND